MGWGGGGKATGLSSPDMPSLRQTSPEDDEDRNGRAPSRTATHGGPPPGSASGDERTRQRSSRAPAFVAAVEAPPWKVVTAFAAVYGGKIVMFGRSDRGPAMLARLHANVMTL